MRSTWFLLGGLLCWTLSLFLYLQPRLWRLEWGYRLAELHQQVIEREEENRGLIAQRARLRAIRRIERIAREELGMALPQEGQVILIRKKHP